MVGADAVRMYRATPDTDLEERVFGLPLGVDTLAVFYNRDLLNAAGIATPPATWTQFQEAVVKLTRVSAGDVIAQSGAALGTSRNVERAFDILSLLMLQNGTEMTDVRGFANFAMESADRTIPGAKAVEF